MRLLLILLFGAFLVAADPDPLLEGLKEQAITYAQAQADSSGGAYVFRIVQPPTLPTLRKGKVSFQASHLSKSDLMGRFFVAFRILVDGMPGGICRVDLEGKWSGKLIRTTSPLPRKAVPDASQVEEVPFEGTPPPGAITSLPEGYRLRVPVGVGRTLTRSDLEPIPLVSAGDRVRVALNWGQLSISSEAIARSNGAKGDRVRLEMPGTKKSFMAEVTAPGEARSEWMGGHP